MLSVLTADMVFLVVILLQPSLANLFKQLLDIQINPVRTQSVDVPQPTPQKLKGPWDSLLGPSRAARSQPYSWSYMADRRAASFPPHITNGHFQALEQYNSSH